MRDLRSSQVKKLVQGPEVGAVIRIKFGLLDFKLPAFYCSEAMDGLKSHKGLDGTGASLVAQTVKNPPAMWETWVRSLGWEDPLEKERLPTPVFLPGEFHGQRSLAGYSLCGLKRRTLLGD